MAKLSRDEVVRLANEEQAKLKFALGDLTMAWADAESALYCILRYYAGVSDPVARAIFSGSRARTMMDFINNITHNTNAEPLRRKDLALVFAQMTAINTMRDRLTHYLSWSEVRFEEQNPQARWLSNADRVNRLGTEYKYSVSSKLVGEMCTDLSSICWHLLAHRDSDPFRPWAGISGKEKSYAWVYKSPPPGKRDDSD